MAVNEDFSKTKARMSCLSMEQLEDWQTLNQQSLHDGSYLAYQNAEGQHMKYQQKEIEFEIWRRRFQFCMVEFKNKVRKGEVPASTQNAAKP